jgi:glycosyltransferase 2 family protein
MTQNLDSNTSVVGPGEVQDLSLAEAGATQARSLGIQGRTILRRLIEVGLSVGCLFLALRAVNPAELWAAFRHANPFWILVFIAMMAGVLLLKAWRWQLLFLPDYHPPFGSLFSILSFSYMLSNVLPGRAGELARVVLLPAEQPVSAARTLATIVVERLLDLLSVLTLLVVLLPFVNLPPEMMHGAQALGVMALLGAAAMILLSYWKERLLRWAHALLRHIRFLDRPPVYSALEHLVDGFAMLRSRVGLAVIGLAMVSWVGVVGLGWAAAKVFGLSVPVTATAFAVVLTSLSQLLPSTPGYIGVFQLAAKMALLPLGVPVAMAEIYAFGWWALSYVTLTIGGLVAMWVHGISFQQVMNWRQKQAKNAASEA